MSDTPNYQPPALSQTTEFRRVDITTLNGQTCSATTTEITITVDPGPGGTLLMDGALVVSDTLCTGDDPLFEVSGGSGQSFEWIVNTGTVTVTNSRQFRASDVGYLFSGTDTVTVRIYDRPLLAGVIDPAACLSNTNSITLTTIIPPVVNLVVTGASSNTFCTGDNVVFTVNPIPAGATNYEFIVNGITTIQNGPSNTTSSSALGDGDQVSVVITFGSGCTATATQTMVENSITAGTISGTQTICFGDAPAQITSVTTPTVSAAASVSYQWQSSTDGFATFNTILSDTPNYTPLAISVNTQFRRVDITTLNGQTCSSTTGPITIIVAPDPVGSLLVNGTSTSSLTICGGDSPIFTITGSTPTSSYRFIIDGSIQLTTNTPTFDPVSLGYVFAGTHVVEAIIYDRPLVGINPDPNACLGNTSSITVSIATGPAVSLTVTGSINDTFCIGENLTFTATSIPSATYNFRVNTITRQNTSSNTFAINSLSDGDAVDVMITLSSGCTVSTTTITLTANEIINSGTISPVTQNICYNSTPTLLSNIVTPTVSSGSASITYEWQSSTDNITFSTIGSENNLNYQPPRLLQTTFFKRIVKSELNNHLCIDESNTIQVNVAPQLFGGNILPAGVENLCFGLLVQPATLTVTNSVTGPLVDYQWQDSADGISWSDIGGANGPSFVPPTLTSTNTLYYRRVTRALGGGAGCEEFSDVHVINVNDIQPGTIDTGANQTYCYGTDIPQIGSTANASSSGGAVSYQWESRTLSSAFSAIAGAVNNVYNPGVLAETTIFRRVAVANTGTITCTSESNEVRVDILNLNDPGSIASDQTVCENIIPVNLTLNGAPAGAGVSYQWENSIDGFNWSTMAGEVNLTLPLTAPATRTNYYRVRVANNPGGLTIPVPNQSQISIRRTLSPLAIGETYFIYINTGTYSFTTSALASDTNSIGTALASQIDSTGGLSAVYDNLAGIISIQPLQTNISVNSNPGSASHELVAIQSVTGDGCIAYTDPVEITVNPAPTLTLLPGRPDHIGGQDVCPGDAIIPFRYVWNNAPELIIEGLDAAYTATPGIGGIINPIVGQPNWYRVTGTNEVTFSGVAGPSNFFRLRTNGSGCSPAQEDYFIEVQPLAIQPDVIMKDINSIDYAVITDGTNWFNNTVCQDRSDIGGGGPTPPTDFYACFIDNGFNLLYNEFDWKVEPVSATSRIVEDERQTAEITFSSATTTITAGALYTVIVDGISYIVTSTVAGAIPVEINDIDELGQQLAIAIGANPAVTANYAPTIDRLTITALNSSTIFTISRNNPTTAGDNAFMTVPRIAVATARVTIEWNEFFSGTASVSVRTAGCGPASSWYTVPVEILPETIPTTTASDLSPPIDLRALDPSVGARLCGGDFTGVTPQCEITASTPNTQYFASTDGGLNDYAALSWTITATSVGDPSVPTPGTIDSSTGVVNWNPGFYGSFDIGVAPVDCNGSVGTRVITNYSIGVSENNRPDIIATNEPDCPIPAGGFQTTLFVPDYPVRWFVNNLGAIQTGVGPNLNSVISNFRRELANDPGTNDQQLTLNWTTGYSGTLFVTAIPRDCPGTSRTYRLNVPNPPDVRYDSGGSINQSLCLGDPIIPITYRLEGAATGIVSGTLGLPPNIRPSISNINQIQRIQLSATTSPIVLNRIYTISIDNNDFDYAVQAPLTLDNVGIGLQNTLRTDPIASSLVSATYDLGTQTLIIEGNIGGRFYDIVPNQPTNNPGVNLGFPTNNGALYFVTLSGNITGATPGVYTYTVTTTSGSASCTLQDSIVGRVTVNDNSQITLISGSLNENVCDGTPITPIQFRIDNANSYDEAGLDASLPPGLDSSIAGGIVTIIGTPSLNPGIPTPFSYTVTSVNNLNGCPETTESGVITILPAPNINAVPGTGSLNQTVCASEAMTPIEFTVSDPAYGLAFVAGGTNLPAGVSGTLITRQQVTEIDFGTTGATVTGTISVVINSGAPFTFNAVATSTFNDAGNSLANNIDSDPRYNAVFASPTLTIRHNNSGVSFSTQVNNGGTNISLSPPDVVTTPAIFVISGSPSVTLAAPFTYSFELEAVGPSCTGTTSNVSGTITVNPATSGALAPGSGAENQTICDNTAFTAIVYDLVGVGSVLSDAGNPVWINEVFDLAGQQLTINGTPNLSNLTQESYEFSYTLIGNFFGCAASTSTLSGIIRVNPADQLTLISGPNNQTVCIDTDIVDIEYEFAGSANAVAFTSPIGLPPGVNGFYQPRNQVSRVNLNANATVVTETYTVFVNSTGYTYIASPAETNTTIGNGLAGQISGDAAVNATYDIATNSIIITSTIPGSSFGIFIPNNTNSVVLSDALLITSPGTFLIRGRPSGTASGTYNYILSTPGTTCAADTELGSITVNQNSGISLISANDNQILCDGSIGVFSNMVYSLEGNVGGIISEGLPNGIIPVLDSAINPTTVTLQGDPITNDTGRNIYNFTLNTVANADGCDETSINGTIIIEPNSILTLTSTLSTQNVCVGVPIDPIIYEFAGGAIATAVTGLPQGLNSRTTFRNQISSIRITGPNVNANEIYSVIIDNVTHTVTTTAGQTPLQVAQSLETAINAVSSVVSASLNGTNLILTALNNQQSFSVRSERSALAQLTFDPPILENGIGVLSITGTPTINAIVGGISTSYSVTVTTINQYGCTEIIDIPVITVDPSSTISITSTSTTLNQEVCENTLMNPITFTIGGNAISAVDDGNLPPGISLNPLGGGNFEITGLANANVTTPTTYGFKIDTFGNTSSCPEASFTATITIIPDDQISLTSANSNQTVCSGLDPVLSLISTITYQLADGATDATVVGLPPGIQTRLNTSTMIYSIFGNSSAVVTSTTPYNYILTTVGSCINQIEIGTITVEPNADLSLKTATSTLDQLVCDDTDINQIEFDLLGSATDAIVTGLPFGVTKTLSGTTIIIRGKPLLGNVTRTIFTFTVTATSPTGCNANSTSGRIIVDPSEQLNHISGDTINQIICDGNDPLNASITPIIYEIDGGATSAFVTGLPPGMSFTFSATTKRLTISGTANTGVNSRTAYNYSVETVGVCSTASLTGIITVDPLPTITLSSAVSTTSQIGASAVCMNNNINEIIYQLGGTANNFNIVGLPNGVNAQFTGVPGEVRISGIPNTGATTSVIHSYTITTIGPCEPQLSLSGLIQVNPSPIIDSNFIRNNDVTNVSCFNGNDGSIVIPASSPQFDLRITGGQNSVSQIDRIAITGNFDVNDRVHVIINGIQFTHIVQETFFGSGVAESNMSIATQLANEITTAVPPNSVPVQAAAAGPADIFITADFPGVPFNISFPLPRVNTTNTGNISNSNVVTNLPLNYNYQWTGPNGYTNTNLSIFGLEAGDYTFEVTLNGCSSGVSTFTITEPDALTISSTACNGAFSATIDGGTPPYLLTLTDNNNVILDQVISNSGKTYIGLTPGQFYTLTVSDSACAIAQREVIQMPFTLQYDPSRTRVVDDYCDESAGTTTGTSNLGGGSIDLDFGGTPAFSGGSNQFIYSWQNTSSGYSNSTMNINGLEPGIYQVTATDIIFGCQRTETFVIDSSPPLVINVLGGTSSFSQPPGGIPTDYLISLQCPDDSATIAVQGNGGSINSYFYNFYRNGTQISSGALNSLTTSATGIYTVEVGVDFSTMIPSQVPSGLNINNLRCVESVTFEVRTPTEMTISEISDRRIIPACRNDLAELVFTVNGGNDNAGPYTVSLEGGALSGSSANAGSREVIITGIDPNNINQINTYTVQDSNGCSFSGSLAIPISLPLYDNVTFQATGQDIDCTNSQQGGIEFAITSAPAPDTSSYGIRVSSNAPNFSYFTNWNNAETQNGNPFIPITQPGNYNYTIVGNPVSGSTTNTSICNIASGTIEISEVENSLVLVRDIITTQPGCGQDYGSIELVIDESTIPTDMFVSWEKIITQTISTTSGTINTQEWRNIPELDRKLLAPDLESGSYRAIINPGASAGNCDNGGTIVTRSLAIGSSVGIDILNLRHVAKRQIPFPCDDPTQLTYDILFLLQNNIRNFAGDFDISVNKISSYGPSYSNFFAAGAPVNVNLISKPLTGDRSGNYIIKDVPFGEYEILISQTGAATNTQSCDAIRSIIIPEIAPVQYTGELSYEIDQCSSEISIEASVQGGQPFVTPNGDSFYRYRWVLTTTSNEIFNYSGQNIIVRDPGSLQLTVFDSTGCEYNVVDSTSPIEVSEGIGPYRLEPRLNNNTEFSEEPSCDNPLRDNGKISFEVLGGDLPQGGQYPYVITWEKFDVGTNSYLEMNGNNGLPDLGDQEFANNLIPGQYKISVVPKNWSCPGQSPFDSVAIERFITVPQNQDLVITNGPLIDLSEYDFTDPNQLTICDEGGAGNLYIRVFNNYDGDLFFYYPTDADLVQSEKIDGQSYRLQIPNSTSDGTLTVVNQEGCRLTVNVSLEIGEPSFRYNSLNAQISGNSTNTQLPLILAREEVTFTSASTGTFTYFEWDFGDGSPVERYPFLTGSVSPVTHIYGISGTYYPKLRLYNSVGCYKETIEILVVGKGYNILAPNVFTPNGDTYNDTFKPLFSGFSYIQMTIYDFRGNLIYVEESTADPANPLVPISLDGWNGETEIQSPYFIYSINGITLFGDTEVQKSGTFIIIR